MKTHHWWIDQFSLTRRGRWQIVLPTKFDLKHGFLKDQRRPDWL